MIQFGNKGLDELIETVPTKQINLSDITSFIGLQNAGMVEELVEIKLESMVEEVCEHCHQVEPDKLIPICEIKKDFGIVQVQGFKALCERCFDFSQLAARAHSLGGEYSSVGAWSDLLVLAKSKYDYSTSDVVEAIESIIDAYAVNFTQSFTWDLTYLHRRGLCDQPVHFFDFPAFEKNLKEANQKAESNANNNKPKTREARANRKEGAKEKSNSNIGNMDPSDNTYSQPVKPPGAQANLFNDDAIVPGDVSVKNLTDLDDMYDESDEGIV